MFGAFDFLLRMPAKRRTFHDLERLLKLRRRLQLTSKKTPGAKKEQDFANDVRAAVFALNGPDSGDLNSVQVRLALRMVGFEFTPTQIDLLIDRYRSTRWDAYKCINPDAFASMIHDIVLNRDPLQEYVNMFRQFDRRHCSEVSFEDLKDVCAEEGETFTDEEILAMIGKHDLDGDGKLNFVEFVRAMEDARLGTAPPEDQ